MAHDLVTELLQYSSLTCFMPIWQLCANLLIPNCLRSNLSYSPLAALEFYVKNEKKAKYPAIRAGNGPFHSTNGSIIVGKYRASGLVINSEQTYNVLLKRADRCNKSNKSITLTIKDRKKNVYEIL